MSNSVKTIIWDGCILADRFIYRNHRVELFITFRGIFNLEFLDSLNNLSWPLFSDEYKQIVERLLEKEYGWKRKGQDIIERYLGKTIASLQEEALQERGRKKPLKDVERRR